MLCTVNMEDSTNDDTTDLEDTKKYTYNTDKGKSEILKVEINRHSKEEQPHIQVKKGSIGFTEKYNYNYDVIPRI